MIPITIDLTNTIDGRVLSRRLETIKANDTFARLKDRVDKGYFEKLIEDYLLDNPHSSISLLNNALSIYGS